MEDDNPYDETPFGVCPVCGGMSFGRVKVRHHANHVTKWWVCDTHRTKWYDGSSLNCNAPPLSEDEQRRADEIASYAEVSAAYGREARERREKYEAAMAATRAAIEAAWKRP